MSKTEKLPLLKDFGAMLRDYRMERGLFQETFADACEIDRSYMGGGGAWRAQFSAGEHRGIVQALNMEPEHTQAINAMTIRFESRNSDHVGPLSGPPTRRNRLKNR